MSRKGRLKMSRKAQSTIEYAVLIGVIVAALLAMQVYLKRGMQGRMKGYAEQLSQGAAYSPGATNSFSEVTTHTLENSVSQDKESNSEVNITQTTNRQEDILPFADEPRRW